jgi:alpha-galactosidase
MSISYDPQSQVFHLKGKTTSYIMQVLRDGYLVHMYWGKRVGTYRGSNPLIFVDRGFSPNPDPHDRTFSLDTLPQEYPAYGNGDFRNPAYQFQFENGSTVTDFRYRSHRIFPGKPPLKGLPAIYTEADDEAETLEIVLEDRVSGLTATLTYTVFRDYDALTRSVQFTNAGTRPVRLLRAMSASVDFRDDDFDLLTLYGAHINERNMERRALVHGIQRIGSARGASSAQQNPFFALLRKGTDEEQGEVYAFNLVYSGNFMAQVEVEQYHTSRGMIGINPFDFSWLLEPGETFQTPEVVMVYSSQGLGEMTQTFHSLYRDRLCRGRHRNQVRPILINNWEATYFNFDADKLVNIAQEAQKLGMELFVLDDGWFGKRDDDNRSLGDWTVDRRKLPDGLKSLAERIEKLGMQFGLWFEPEMVSVDSELYREHPDWCIQVPERPFTFGRNQLVLDLSREDVCDYLIRAVSAILGSAPIRYVKWDMNRHMTEIGSVRLPPERQRETAHRYMLGLYRVMEEITGRFPEILFESCSGGGGRFDPGMLHYMPQTWASDNTDAVSRLKIQYGTSLLYPVSSIGSHVSTVPNHQMHRITSLETRGHVAMSGNLGYELDLTKLTDSEKQTIKRQVELYKEIRPVVQFGVFHRLLSPFEGNETAWMFVTPDRKEAVFCYVKVLAEPADAIRILRLKGLDPNLLYRHLDTGHVFDGDELMNCGITIPRMEGDFASLLWRFQV